MAFRASSCGHISITPALNAAEFEYLTAFVESRRHGGRSGPYDVPNHPAVDSVVNLGQVGDGSDAPRRAMDVDTYNSVVYGQPSLWCPWVPSCNGKCLALEDDEKISAPVTWLQYFVDHFLAPQAESATSGLPQFADFTYNHVLGGAVALHSMESNELSLIKVEAFTVVEEVVTRADPEPYGPSRGWVA